MVYINESTLVNTQRKKKKHIQLQDGPIWFFEPHGKLTIRSKYSYGNLTPLYGKLNIGVKYRFWLTKNVYL